MNEPSESQKMMHSALEQWSNVQEIARRYSSAFPDSSPPVESSVREGAAKSLQSLRCVSCRDRVSTPVEETPTSLSLLQVLESIERAS